MNSVCTSSFWRNWSHHTSNILHFFDASRDPSRSRNMHIFEFEPIFCKHIFAKHWHNVTVKKETGYRRNTELNSKQKKGNGEKKDAIISFKITMPEKVFFSVLHAFKKEFISASPRLKNIKSLEFRTQFCSLLFAPKIERREEKKNCSAIWNWLDQKTIGFTSGSSQAL